jgi:hypothetical protein
MNNKLQVYLLEYPVKTKKFGKKKEFYNRMIGNKIKSKIKMFILSKLIKKKN